MTDTDRNNVSGDIRPQTLGMDYYLFYHATPLVKVIVGGLTEPERVFHIHEGLLVLRSDFFKSALHEHWASGVEKEVHLIEESVQAFGAFARWIYNDLDLVPGDHLHTVKAYVLGEKLLAPAFQGALVKEMEDNILDAVYVDAITATDVDHEGSEAKGFEPMSVRQVVELAPIVYGGTSRCDDPMRNLLLRYVATRMHNDACCPGCLRGSGVDLYSRSYNVKPWKTDAMRVLVDSGQNDFLCDVLALIPRLCIFEKAK